MSLAAFARWAQPRTDGGDSATGQDAAWGYVSYQYTQQMFVEQHPEIDTVSPFRELFQSRVPTDHGKRSSTPIIDERNAAFWFGTAGARTHCHRDAYGWNVVAQLHGRKHWRLLPPDCTALTPTRLPYEESTIYCHENVRAGDFGVDAGLYDILLEEGHVLIVPPGWWHDVLCETTSVSINLWLPLPVHDAKAKLQEAVVSFFLRLVGVGNDCG